MNTRLEALRAAFNDAKASYDSLVERASSPDLSDDERAELETQIDEAHSRAIALKPQIDKELQRNDDLSSVASLFAKVPVSPVSTPAPVARATGNPVKESGDYAFNFVRTLFANTPYANGDQLSRALSVVNSSASPGLLPYSIVGDIIKFTDARRYAIDSLNLFPVPAGGAFKRRVYSSSTGIVAPSPENTDLGANGYPTVDYVDVSTATYAGGVRITLEADNFTDPSAGDLLLNDLYEQYAIKTDTVVAAALKAAATVSQPLPVSGATPKTFMDSVMYAADYVYSQCKKRADTIWCTPDVRRFIATLCGSDGHFAFPFENPQNRDGGADGVAWQAGLHVGELRVVVEPNFASSTFIVGCSQFGEVYESMFGVLSATQPSTLSREVALAGRLGTYFRSEGFVEMVDTDGSSSATPNFAQ